MEILDPDLWNDDGTPKRPSRQYMESLNEAQMIEAMDPEVIARRQKENEEAFVLSRKRLLAETAPVVGDVVHFWDGEHCRAAIVMEIEDHEATLRVHIPNKPFEDWTAGHDEGKSDDSWHWAETGR